MIQNYMRADTIDLESHHCSSSCFVLASAATATAHRHHTTTDDDDDDDNINEDRSFLLALLATFAARVSPRSEANAQILGATFFKAPTCRTLSPRNLWESLDRKPKDPRKLKTCFRQEVHARLNSQVSR